MDARLHWVEVFDQRFPVNAKTRQAALVAIIKKLRREAKVSVASMNEIYQAGRDGVEILGVSDADSDDCEHTGDESGAAPEGRTQGRRGRRGLGSRGSRAGAEGAS